MAKYIEYTCPRDGVSRIYYKNDLVEHMATCAWCKEERRRKRIALFRNTTEPLLFTLADLAPDDIARIGTQH